MKRMVPLRSSLRSPGVGGEGFRRAGIAAGPRITWAQAHTSRRARL